MKTLLFDIETSPNLAHIWGIWEQNAISVERDWFILSYAFKWLGEKKITARGLPDFGLYRKEPNNDRELVKSLWKLFDEADIIIAQNGDAFDIKKANARFVEHGLKPPSPYKTIDTKKVAKKYFKFDSNKLDELGRHLGVGRKIHTDKELWLGCLRGDKKAWQKMLEYNKQDVILLEEVYLKLRGWITNPPQVADYGQCPNCGEHHLQKKGKRRVRNGWKQMYQCMACGAWSQGNLLKMN